MVTECSYDYVFVYDGETYDSPLLGAFSGATKPDVLVATSQYVSFMLYAQDLFRPFCIKPRQCIPHNDYINL